MSDVVCVIQEGGAADTARDRLANGLAELHGAHHPGDTIDVTWRAVPEGYMFTEGRQSTSSVISCTLPRPTTVVEREAYMRSVCDLWTEVTGCTDHEVVVSVSTAQQEEA